MTKTATVTFDTKLVDNPSALTLGKWAVSLLLAGAVVGDVVQLDDKTAPVVFNITGAGDYTVSVTRLTFDGAVFGDPATTAFTVVADQVEVPLSVTVTLTQAPAAA